jgi:L-alanine-DL-glutamate epimerase-like enolase superfamily enzyme
MSTYSLIADLPVVVDSYGLEGLEQAVSSEFVRRTTVVHLHGAGEEGVGEDVIYDADDQLRFQAAGPVLDVAGEHTLDSLSARFDGMPDYRRWGFESAALDLALRQGGLSLHAALGRELRPVTFVVSTALGADRVERLRRLRAEQPGMRFKLDPTSDWDDDLIAALVDTGAVDSVDFKGHYHGTVVDNPPDPDLYRRVVEAFPDAWIEDPALTDETLAVFTGSEDRITWDAPIHSIADIEAAPFPPKMVNVKLSRFGGLRALMEAYDYLAERGIRAYGGGQFELGPGRGHIQYLASLFHPDTPNDVAPGGYNAPDPEPGLPASPLEPRPSETGFRWGEE